VCYRLALPLPTDDRGSKMEDRSSILDPRSLILNPRSSILDLPRRLTELLNGGPLWVERTRPRPRRLDLRPFLHAVRLVDGHLEMDLWVSASAGTARPEEILHVLELADLLEAGAILERCKLELRDELPETETKLIPNFSALVEERTG